MNVVCCEWLRTVKKSINLKTQRKYTLSAQSAGNVYNEFTQLVYFIFPDYMRMWREI